MDSFLTDPYSIFSELGAHYFSGCFTVIIKLMKGKAK